MKLHPYYPGKMAAIRLERPRVHDARTDPHEPWAPKMLARGEIYRDRDAVLQVARTDMPLPEGAKRQRLGEGRTRAAALGLPGGLYVSGGAGLANAWPYRYEPEEADEAVEDVDPVIAWAREQLDRPGLVRVADEPEAPQDADPVVRWAQQQWAEAPSLDYASYRNAAYAEAQRRTSAAMQAASVHGEPPPDRNVSNPFRGLFWGLLISAGLVALVAWAIHILEG